MGVFDLVPGFPTSSERRLLVTASWPIPRLPDVQQVGSQLDYQLANLLFVAKYDDEANKFDFNAITTGRPGPVGIQNLAYLVKRDIYHVEGTTR